MGHQHELFPKKFYVGQKNIIVHDGKYQLIDCEVLEIDNPLVLIKYRNETRYNEIWFHENLIEIVNEEKLI